MCVCVCARSTYVDAGRTYAERTYEETKERREKREREEKRRRKERCSTGGEGGSLSHTHSTAHTQHVCVCARARVMGGTHVCVCVFVCVRARDGDAVPGCSPWW
jgi:hypothetical protein